MINIFIFYKNFSVRHGKNYLHKVGYSVIYKFLKNSENFFTAVPENSTAERSENINFANLLLTARIVIKSQFVKFSSRVPSSSLITGTLHTKKTPAVQKI